MPTLFITGANRGIGLELVRQYVADEWRILATCRDPDQASELVALAEAHADRIEILELEVTDWDRTAVLGRTLADTPIDLLLANAGIRGRGADDFGTLDPAEWVETDMGGENAPVEVAESADGMRRVIRALGPEHSGRFFQYDGVELPW